MSHSSMGDFLKCPRAYYLHNIYKDPKTKRKVNIVAPPLALGQAVHQVLENLALLPAEDRLKIPLTDTFETVWQNVSGKKGGFLSKDEEAESKERGRQMLLRVMANPGPIVNKAVKMKQDLPNYFISEEDNIILCGKIDWLEYLPEQDAVHVIDFKTGRNEEKEDSLQLPIYHLLVKHCQRRKVAKASYWYLDKESGLVEKTLPNLEEAHEKVLKVAKEVKSAREANEFVCPHGGCFSCRPFEAIVSGHAEFVGTGEYNQDMYIVPKVDKRAFTEETEDDIIQ